MILTKKSRCFFYTLFQEVVILEIYLDVLFLENFLIDYILLLLTGKILQKQMRGPGMLFAAMLGGVYTLFCRVLMLWGAGKANAGVQVAVQVVNILFAYIMVKCAYENTKRRQALFCVGTMYILAFVTEGMLSWIQETLRSRMLTALGTVWFGYLFLKKWIVLLRERMFYRKCNLPVVVRMFGKEIVCRGLMDSGNSLYEPITHRPVVIVEKELLLQHDIGEPETYFAIPYHAIGTQNGILKGVLADELEILGQQGARSWQKVMLGIYEGKISRQNEYQVILHPKL